MSDTPYTQNDALKAEVYRLLDGGASRSSIVALFGLTKDQVRYLIDIRNIDQKAKKAKAIEAKENKRLGKAVLAAKEKQKAIEEKEQAVSKPWPLRDNMNGLKPHVYMTHIAHRTGVWAHCTVTPYTAINIPHRS